MRNRECLWEEWNESFNKASLIEKATISKDIKKKSGLARQMSGRRVIQVKRTAGSKDARWEHAWHLDRN